MAHLPRGCGSLRSRDGCAQVQRCSGPPALASVACGESLAPSAGWVGTPTEDATCTEGTGQRGGRREETVDSRH